MARDEAIESRIVGALPLLRQICRDIGLAQVVNEMTDWDRDRCRLSPGQRIEALVLDVLHRRSPLYRVAKAYSETATELVLGEEIGPAELTDDALARALDKVGRAGAAKVKPSFSSAPRGGSSPPPAVGPSTGCGERG